jgi:hypothetical protein
MGAVYLIAFTSLRSQLIGLYGKRGLLPIDDLLARARPLLRRERFRLLPTLLWWDSSDAALLRLCDRGQWCASFLIAGVAPRLMSAALWLAYLSFVSVGREFLSFQWDSLLLESGLDTIIIAPPGLAPRRRDEDTPWPALLLMRWLVFRLHFESGLCKLQSHDPTWRHFTACTFHHETQPLPTSLGWYAHHLPRRLQRLSTLLTLIIECGAPFLIAAPRRLRKLAFTILTGFQALIAASGNYGFFNLLTIVQGLWLLDDDMLERSIVERLRIKPPPKRAPWWRRWLTAGAAAPIVALSGAVLLARTHLLHRFPRALARLHDWEMPLRSVNSYGLFSVMTTRRPEIIIEGSHDGRRWLAYELPHKPGALAKRPRFVAPHQPRLDWQLWFAALGAPAPWFERLLLRLLEGAPEVLRLIAHNPFPDRPPRYVRALLYDYEMTDLPTRRRTGRWWRRRLLGQYFPICTLARRPVSDEKSPILH